MGLFSDAAAMARGRAGAILLTSALALVPAYFLAGGIAFLASHAGERMDLSAPAGSVAEKSRALPPDAAAADRRDLLREASDPGAPERPRMSLPVAAGLVLASLVVIAGLFFAQAALLQLATGALRPGAAWAAVGHRFPALSATIAAAIALIAFGMLILALPGLFAAFAFSLAGAVAIAENASGFRALQRSWELVKRAWPEMLALIVGTCALVVLLTRGLGRFFAEGAPLARALLDAAVAAVVLPLPVFASAVVYLRERSAAQRKPVEEIRQYIRRSSEPG